MHGRRKECIICAILVCDAGAWQRYKGRRSGFKLVKSERGKRIEIRSQWADVFCEFCSGRGPVVLLCPQRIWDAENPRVNGRDSVRLVYHAARRAGEGSGELKSSSQLSVLGSQLQPMCETRVAANQGGRWEAAET